MMHPLVSLSSLRRRALAVVCMAAGLLAAGCEEAPGPYQPIPQGPEPATAVEADSTAAPETTPSLASDGAAVLGETSGALNGVPTVTLISPLIDTFLTLPDGASPADPPAANTINVEVEMTVSDHTLTGGGSGNRVHVYLDGTLVATRYDTDTFEVTGVTHGEHTLALVLAGTTGTELTHEAATSSSIIRVRRVCQSDSDCTDSRSCNVDRCLADGRPGGWKTCRYGEGTDPSCCDSAYDCAHGQICNSGACVDCLSDSDCEDNRACTSDSCVNNTCVNTRLTGPQYGSQNACCETNTDCNDDNACTVDACDAETHVCTNTAIDGCCNGDSECTGSNACQIGRCIDNGCRFGPIQGCCLTDSQCSDGNPCTTDTCNTSENVCEHTTALGGSCCTDSQQCEDGLSHTMDFCSRNTNSCRNVVITNYCDNSGNFDCTDTDDNPCTQAQCINSQCKQVAIDGCCASDNDCFDGNICTNDTCKNGKCSFTRNPLCCENSPDCGDGNSCTTDVCFLGSCRYGQNKSFDGKCCRTNADCDDKNTCTTEVCGVDSICVYTAVTTNSNPNSGGNSGTVTAADTDGDGMPNSSDPDIDGDGLNNAVDPDMDGDGIPNRLDPDPRGLLSNLVDTDDDGIPNINDPDIDGDGILNDKDDDMDGDGTPNADDEDPNGDGIVDTGTRPDFGTRGACCLSVDDCDDGSVLTRDRCVNNRCEFVPTGACSTLSDCEDGNPCTTERCSDRGFCIVEDVADCCQVDKQCNDGQRCTTDRCVNNTCVNTDIENCCSSNAACDDGNPCNEDSCVEGVCRHTADNPLCCTQGGDCDDGNPCTTDSCTLAGRCEFVPSFANGCCNSDAECFDGDSCTKDVCVDGQCANVYRTTCCDEHSDCADDSLCTTDRCVHGYCRHFPPNIATHAVPDICCGKDADCPDDGSACTSATCGANGLCQFSISSPCIRALPYSEPFDTFKTWNWYGWQPLNLTGSDDVRSNFILSSAGPLGRDSHVRFHWAPTSSAYDAVFVSPLLDASAATRDIIFQYEWATKRFGGTTTIKTYYSLDTDWANGTLLRDVTVGDGSNAGKVTMKLPDSLKGQQFYVYFRLTGATSFDVDYMDFDNVAVAEGNVPSFVSPPTILKDYAGLRTDSVVIQARDTDRNDTLTISKVSGPSFVSVQPTFYNNVNRTWDAAVVLEGGLSDAGEYEVTLRVSDGVLTRDVTIDLVVLKNRGWVIWRPAGVPTAYGTAIANALTSAGYVNQILTDATVYNDVRYGGNLDGLFVTLGNVGQKHTLTASEVAWLQNWLNNNAPAYLEGGDFWHNDAPNAAKTMFHVGTINGGQLRMASPVQGASMVSTLSFALSQSATLNTFLDELTPAQTTGNANRIFERSNGGRGAVSAVAYDSALDSLESADFRTIGSSRPIAALSENGGGTLVALMRNYVNFLLNGFPTTGCADGWGDCDGDGSNGCETRLNADPHCGACNSPCKDDGNPCSTADECTSGVCADGVCCATTCTADCYACNVAGSEGTCSPQAAGTQCGATTCSDFLLDAANTCDGSGNCTGGPGNPVLLSQFGAYGSGDGQLDGPFGLATDGDNNVYVVDRNNSRVQKFNSSGTFQAKVGSAGSGNGQFSAPRYADTTSDSRLLVTDTGNSRVQVFNANLTWLSNITMMEGPIGVTVDSSDNIFVTTDGDAVAMFDSAGTFVRTWGTTGGANGQFRTPVGIATDSLDRVYVVDQLNHRVQIFDTSGNYLAQIGNGIQGLGDDQMNSPTDITIDDEDNVYVRMGHLIRMYNTSGVLQRSLTLPNTVDWSKIGISAPGAKRFYVAMTRTSPAAAEIRLYTNGAVACDDNFACIEGPGECRDGCTTSGHCAPGYVCANGSCTTLAVIDFDVDPGFADINGDAGGGLSLEAIMDASPAWAATPNGSPFVLELGLIPSAP